MNLSRIATVSIPILLVGVAACSGPGPATPTPSPVTEEVRLSPTSVQPTVQWKTSTPVPTFTPTPSPEPTATNTQVPTLTPTRTPTSTLEPMAKIAENLTLPVRVRSGPGTIYPVVNRLEPGQEAVVTGRNDDNTWWQIRLEADGTDSLGWVFGELVTLAGNDETIPVVEPDTPSPSPSPSPDDATPVDEDKAVDEDDTQNPTAEELADNLRCGQDFCVTYQAMVPMWENGGCVGNHSIYITVLEGLPPGRPMDGVVVGDTFNNVEVASGSHGPGHTEITLWNNSMTLLVKRHIDGTLYTSEESFNFTSHDELIPAEVLAANGYCGGSVEQCEHDRHHNSVCRGHYSWRVTFHKLD